MASHNNSKDTFWLGFQANLLIPHSEAALMNKGFAKDKIVNEIHCKYCNKNDESLLLMQ